MFKKLFQKKTKEEKFWNWFIENEAELFYGTDNEADRERIFDGLTERIKAIDSNLAFEFSPISEEDRKEFIISADGIQESFVQVESLISVAPNHIHWDFLAFRQPIAGDDIKLKMGDLEIGYTDIYFRFMEEGDQLSVQLNIRNFDGSGFQQNAVYLLLDSLLGEFDTVTEIDVIDWEILNETENEKCHPFIELRNLISRRKDKK